MEMNSDKALKHDRSVMFAKRPKVLIVGAGIGGLTLGMLLHKANIPFEIYERAAVVKPLVGADGAYSAVRQGLYDKLKKAGRLPPADALPLPFNSVCLVGQTRPLTAEEFPDIWVTFTTAQNTVVFDIVQSLTNETSKENDAFKNSEWGPEAALPMCQQVKDFPIVSGGDKKLTLGDLFAWTSWDQVSKVMLEEKVFKTWYDCRTVLIGDACHKFSPSGGVGATHAMHDAIVLANRINGLPFHPIAEEIVTMFKEYQEERIDWVIKGFESSKVFKSMAGQHQKRPDS
ncbi:hypothetical protein BGZ96_011621 [Linnemannia gamsii]|uniref:FAD-binding domain-containing protein n=1 Tax=Linnemannia gamsii TaxID=64522 RepID=A0ABQ7JS98_9FUNG|nr:hypothetical protein BGZ96_011621 [Linnemannia gamsii]